MQQKYSNIETQTGVHIAGICNIQIAPKEWLDGDIVKNFLTNTITTAITLKADRSFIKLNLLPQSFNFTEKVKSADAGQYYDIEISGETNGITPDVLQVLNTLRFHKFICVLTDAKGRQRLVGTRYTGLQLMFGTSTDNKDAEQHIPISLSMQSPEPAPYLVL